MSITCLVKYFGIPEITRNEVKNVFNHLLCTPLSEVMQMEETGEFPGCMRLLIKALLHDMEAGRMDTLNRILDFVI